VYLYSMINYNNLFNTELHNVSQTIRLLSSSITRDTKKTNVSWHARQ